MSQSGADLELAAARMAFSVRDVGRVARGECHRLLEQAAGAGQIFQGKGRLGVHEQGAHFAPPVFVEAGHVVVTQRGETGLIGGRGANKDGYTRPFRVVQHGAEVGIEVACGGLAQGRVRGDERPPDHLFHEAAVFVRTLVEPAVQHLYEGQAACGAHHA